MKKEIRKELEEMNSSLAQNTFKKEYEIPEGYFNKMQDEVLQKIKSEHNQRSHVFKLRSWMYASAAIIVLVIGSIIIFTQNTSSNSGFERLETEAIYAYLDDNLDEISLQTLLPAFSETDLLDIEENTELLEDYIEENLEDMSIEELENLL